MLASDFQRYLGLAWYSPFRSGRGDIKERLLKCPGPVMFGEAKVTVTISRQTGHPHDIAGAHFNFTHLTFFLCSRNFPKYCSDARGDQVTNHGETTSGS